MCEPTQIYNEAMPLVQASFFLCKKNYCDIIATMRLLTSEDNLRIYWSGLLQK